MREREPNPFQSPDKGGEFGGGEREGEREDLDYKFKDPREVLNRWLSDESRKDEDVLHRDFNHQLRSDFNVPLMRSDIASMILGKEDPQVKQLDAATMKIGNAIEPLLAVSEVTSLEEIENSVQSVDEPSAEWERIMTEIIAQHPEKPGLEADPQMGYLNTVDLLKLSLKGVEGDKQVPLKEMIDATLAGLVPSVEKVKMSHFMRTTDQKIVKILLGRREDEDFYSRDDDDAAYELAEDLQNRGSNFGEFLKEQGFKVDVNVPSDLAVSERFSRAILKNHIMRSFVDAIANSENRGESQMCRGFFRVELKREKDGNTLYTSHPVTDDEARRLSSMEKKSYRCLTA